MNVGFWTFVLRSLYLASSWARRSVCRRSYSASTCARSRPIAAFRDGAPSVRSRCLHSRAYDTSPSTGAGEAAVDETTPGPSAAPPSTWSSRSSSVSSSNQSSSERRTLSTRASSVRRSAWPTWPVRALSPAAHARSNSRQCVSYEYVHTHFRIAAAESSNSQCLSEFARTKSTELIQCFGLCSNRGGMTFTDVRCTKTCTPLIRTHSCDSDRTRTSSTSRSFRFIEELQRQYTVDIMIKTPILV